jgi:hypothetical protein
MRHLAAAVVCGLAVACGAPGGASAANAVGTDPTALEIGSLQQRFAAYTLEDARRNGYEPDRFCLDAASFGLAPHLGAMGYHVTDPSILRGPIAVDRPQALMFDAQDRLIGVEYEIVADAVKEAPRLFGRTFSKLPPHPGVSHEHYALHLWLVPNPNGRSADFNPIVSCPAGSSPGAPRGTAVPMPEPEHGAGH